MSGPRYTGYEYRLRAGSPIVRAGGGGILQTFMAEKTEVTMISVLGGEDILTSSNFSANGGEYISAEYSRYNDKSGNKFSGREVKKPEYIQESEMGV